MTSLNIQRISEQDARLYIEQSRWPNGPVCPHCGVMDEAKPIVGPKSRPGLYRCGACVKQYTVTVGTIFEGSHIPLNIWLKTIALMCASKKGVSALQVSRMMGVT